MIILCSYLLIGFGVYIGLFASEFTDEIIESHNALQLSVGFVGTLCLWPYVAGWRIRKRFKPDTKYNEQQEE